MTGTGEKLERATRVAQALGALFERTRVPVIAVEPSGEFVAANDAAVLQYGYALGELLGMRIQDLQAFGRPVDADLSLAHSGDQAPLDRRPHRRKDGSIVWVVPTAGPIDVLGHPLVVSVLKDVTALVSAEESARWATEHNRRDRRIVESVVVSMKGQHELTPALDALVEAFGQATGHAASIWLPDDHAASGPPRVLRMAAAYAVRGETAMAGEEIVLARETLGMRAWCAGSAIMMRLEDTADGSEERALAASVGDRGFVVPLIGRSGSYGLLYGLLGPDDDAETALSIATTLGGFGGVMLEAIELEHRARREGQNAEITWQAAVERMGSGFALLDRDRRVVRVNQALCQLLKCDAADLVGKPCREVFALCKESDASHEACPHELAARENRRVVREIVSEGSGRALRIEVLPAPSLPPDSVIATIHVSHDLTEERAVRCRLVSTDRLATIGRLAAGVAHEVNNPAAFVTLALQLIKKQVASGKARPGHGAEEVAAMLDEAVGAMLQINEIMRDLTGFARERSRSPSDLAIVANSAIRIAAHETKGRATVERVQSDGVIAHVHGARIAQVVLNLVVNAAQAIPPGDPGGNRIDVRVYRDGDRACIDVEDTGPGIPLGIGDRIFEPFFTTRDSSGGTGLGLWLSRSIIEEEGGTLTYRGFGAGGGACFTVSLPAPAADDARDVRGDSRPRLDAPR